MKSDHLEPPEHLSARARQLWCNLCETRCKSPERRALLLSALEALDRADEARAILATEGLIHTTRKTGAKHVHPAAKVEADSRRLFAKLWGTLGLSFNQSLDAEPSKWPRKATI